MLKLSQAQLLDLWEIGQVQSPLQFSMNLLCEALPSLNLAQAALLPVGKRDSILLKLRESIFGPYFSNLAICPSCEEKVEWEMNIDNFMLPELSELILKKTYELKKGSYFITFRLPNTRDIINASSANNKKDVYRYILSECIHDIKYKRKSLEIEKLPEEVVNSISEQMNIEDKHADIQISLTCPHCLYIWNITFDIISYLWDETNAWAYHVLREIGIIATNFGWSEEEILNLSSIRRQTYLEILEA